MIQWYAFQSKARKEQLLCEQLRIRQIETFFPRIFAWPARSGSVRVEPYFPGYVFGQVDLERVGKSILEWIPGAIGIVNFGGEPVSISDHLINALQQHLETAQVAASKTWEEFQVGDLITINGGPFAGYEGIFNARLPGRDRVEVFLRLIQDKQIRVELSIEQISLRKT